MVTVAELMTEEQVQAICERSFIRTRVPRFVKVFVEEVVPLFDRWADDPTVVLALSKDDEPDIGTDKIQQVRNSIIASGKRLGHNLRVRPLHTGSDEARLLISYGGEYVPESPAAKEARIAKTEAWRRLLEEHRAA
jgi:hypothetical protein